MARKISNTIEFFQHYANKQSRTIAKLESKYGNDGYAFFFRLLEMLASTENHYLDLSEPNDMDYFAMRMRIETDVCEKILTDLVNWKKLDRDLWELHRGVWYEKFVSNHSHVYEKRKRKLPDVPVISGTEMQANPDSCHRNTTTTPIPVPESTHSIVEDSNSIVEDRIVEDISFKKRNKRVGLLKGVFKNHLSKHKEHLANRKKEKAAQTRAGFLQMLDACQKLYPGTKRGTETEFADLEKKYKKEFTVIFFRNIYRGIQAKLKYHHHLEANKADFIPSWPHFKTYLNQRKWEEQTNLANINSKTNGNGSNQNNQPTTGISNAVRLAIALAS